MTPVEVRPQEEIAAINWCRMGHLSVDECIASLKSRIRFGVRVFAPTKRRDCPCKLHIENACNLL